MRYRIVYGMSLMSALEIKLPERQIRNMGSYYIRFYLEAFTFFSHSKLPNP